MKSTKDDPGTAPPLTVFRPRRRCERCGLVNADSAKRCRRCQAPFGRVDRAGESEALVRRLAARRSLVVGLAIVVLAGLVIAGGATYLRYTALARFSESARSLEVDLTALGRGARADAAAIASAFDDDEARELMRDQQLTWGYRAERCSEIATAIGELVPRSPDDARRVRALADEADLVGRTSRDLTRACEALDVDAARRAASTLAPKSE